MSILGKVTEPVKKWIFKVALKNAVKTGVKLIAAWAAGQKMQQFGITFDVDPAVLSGAVYVGIDSARKWAKIKFPDTLGWL